MNKNLASYQENPVILYRDDIYSREEIEVAQKYLSVQKNRVLCKDRLVIGRYSVLPYYQNLEEDLKLNNCRLINSYDQHRWIANFDYYETIREFTPESWQEEDIYRIAYPGPFVVKGVTNSKKHQWNTMMFARDRAELIEVCGRLRQDGLIGT